MWMTKSVPSHQVQKRKDKFTSEIKWLICRWRIRQKGFNHKTLPLVKDPQFSSDHADILATKPTHGITFHQVS